MVISSCKCKFKKSTAEMHYVLSIQMTEQSNWIVIVASDLIEQTSGLIYLNFTSMLRVKPSVKTV